MSTVESVLTRRHASLGDLVALLQRQHDATLDVVVSARDMCMAGGNLHIEGIGEPTLTPDGVTPARGVFRPTATCDGGIADKLGIPSQYLRRMRETHVDLLDDNVNTWLGDDPATRYLIRTLRGDGDHPGIARALLSEKYKITDNLDVLMAVLDGIRRTGVHTRISHCDLTEKRMYVKVGFPEVAAAAPRLLADYRSPFTGLRGGQSAGVRRVRGQQQRDRARQLLDHPAGHRPGLRQRHDLHPRRPARSPPRRPPGRRGDPLERRHPRRGPGAGGQAGPRRRDRLPHPRLHRREIAEVEAEAGIPVRDVEATVEYVGKQLRFTTDQQTTILNHFIDGGDRNCGGVLHAVTSTAQTLPDADDVYELERRGLTAMILAASVQR